MINKAFFTEIGSKFGKFIAAEKRNITKILVSIVALFLTSFLIEYYGFGRQFNQYRFLFILSIGALLLIFYALRKKIGERPELGFLAVALICGSLLVISEPHKYISWDEQIHYKHAEKAAATFVSGMFFRPNTVSSSYSIVEQKKIDSLVDSQYKKPLTKSSGYGFSYDDLPYIPSIIAIVAGNLIHLPYHVTFTFGRWMNLLFFAVIVFFAIKKMKSVKMVMSVVALLPTSIFLASNYNHDSWLTAFTLLGLGYLFSELQQPDKKITWREVAIMIAAFVIGLGAKSIYFPLMLLMFLLRPEKFTSTKQYKKYLLAVVLSILLVLGSLLLPFAVKGTGSGDSRGGSAVNASQQIRFILTEPAAYAKTLSNFMLGYIDPRNAFGFTTFFAYLGGFKNYLFYLVLAILALVTFTDKNEFDKNVASWKIRVPIIIIYLATVALISTALYVAFTPVGSSGINGVQPRYLIPLVFPLLLVIGSSRFRNKLNKNIYNTAIFGVMAYVLLQGTWDLIISRYYQ